MDTDSLYNCPKNNNRLVKFCTFHVLDHYTWFGIYTSIMVLYRILIAESVKSVSGGVAPRPEKNAQM